MLNYPDPDESNDRSQNPGQLPVDTIGNTPLRVGDDNDENLVKHVQKMLFELGYLLGAGSRFIDGVDGLYNLRTKAAVEQFQRDHKDFDSKQLDVDGVVGELTADALNREMVGIWYATYPSEDKDGNAVPEDDPLVTHDVDNPLKIPADSFRVVLHAQGTPPILRPDRSVNYVPNDPEADQRAAGSSPPDPPPRFLEKEVHLLFLHSSESLPAWSIRNATPGSTIFPPGTDTAFHPTGPSANFPRGGRFPAGGGFPAGTGDFDFQAGQVSVCVARTIRMWRLLGVKFGAWQAGNPLEVTLQSADPDAVQNAFYNRPRKLELGFNLVQPGQVVAKPFAADSPDIVSHELGHGTLDTIASGLFNSGLRTVDSFHESFGDMTAMLTTLTDPDVREELLSENNGDLSKSNVLSRLAEEFGQLFDPNANALRDAALPNPSPDFPFNYVNPDTLGVLPVDTLRNVSDGGDGPLAKGDSRSDLVIELQKLLKTLKFDLGDTGPNKDGIDGDFGDKTDQAVRDFQQNNTDSAGNALKVDGLVGPLTANALDTQAGFEVHDFSRIFTMAFYDTLVNAFNRLTPSGADDDQKDSALREAAGCVGLLLGRAILRTPFPVAGYYRVIARNMFIIDKQFFSQEFRGDLIGNGDGNGFVGRNIIKQDEVSKPDVSP